MPGPPPCTRRAISAGRLLKCQPACSQSATVSTVASQGRRPRPRWTARPRGAAAEVQRRAGADAWWEMPPRHHPFRMPGKLLTRNYLRLVGKLLQDCGERVAEVQAFEAVPQGGESHSAGPERCEVGRAHSGSRTGHDG